MFRPVVNVIDKTIFHLLIWSRRDHPAFPLIKSGWLVNRCSVALLNIPHELYPAPYLIHWSRDSTFPLRTSQLPVNSRLYCRNWKCTKVIIRLMMQKLTYQPADGWRAGQSTTSPAESRHRFISLWIYVKDSWKGLVRIIRLNDMVFCHHQH